MSDITLKIEHLGTRSCRYHFELYPRVHSAWFQPTLVAACQMGDVRRRSMTYDNQIRKPFLTLCAREHQERTSMYRPADLRCLGRRD